MRFEKYIIIILFFVFIIQTPINIFAKECNEYDPIDILKLNPADYEIFINMVYYIVNFDIKREVEEKKNSILTKTVTYLGYDRLKRIEEEKNLKMEWLSKWEKQIKDETPSIKIKRDPLNYISQAREKSSNKITQDLLFLQLWTFTPYYPIDEKDKKSKRFNKLGFDEANKQESIHKIAEVFDVNSEYVDNLYAKYKANLRNIQGYWKKVFIVSGIVVVITVATWGVGAIYAGGAAAGGAATGGAAAGGAAAGGAAAGGAGSAAFTGAGLMCSLKLASEVTITWTTIITHGAIIGVSLTTGALGMKLAATTPNLIADRAAKGDVIFEEILKLQEREYLAQEMMKRQNESIDLLNQHIEEVEEEIKKMKSERIKDKKIIKLLNEQINNLKKSREYLKRSWEQKKNIISENIS